MMREQVMHPSLLPALRRAQNTGNQLAGAAADAIESLLQWQPIETAPKDRTSVMLFPHYVVSHWEQSLGAFVDFDDREEDYVAHRIKFTHWMPLPPPPKEPLIPQSSGESHA